MSLLDRIKDRIRDKGPITVADYMNMALADEEEGYYMKQDPLGADFITSPEISQVFGELVGAWLARQWEVMGKPKAALVELGPGRGTLMADALRATKRVQGFHDAITVHLVETSPSLRQKQWHSLAGKHNSIEWHGSFDEVPKKPLLLIANEFFDALPIRQFLWEKNEWKERTIGLDAHDDLTFTVTPIKGKIPAALSSRPQDHLIHEISDPSRKIAEHIGAHVKTHGGVALIVDYGYAQAKGGDSLQAMRQHQYEPVLNDPGQCDLTAHVDFSGLREAALAKGANVFGPAPQGLFLMRIGIAVRAANLSKTANEEQKSAIVSAVERLASPEQMGALFKVLCIAHPDHPRPEGLQP